jgi:hypothetical protein
LRGTADFGVRFAYDQGGHYADAHEQGHDLVTQVPVIEVRQVKGTCTCHQQGHAVAAHIGRGHGTLVTTLLGLDTPGVDGDVLGGRGKGNEDSEQGQGSGLCGRVEQGHGGKA